MTVVQHSVSLVMCTSKALLFHKRPGCMTFAESKIALLRTHFPKCSDEIETVLESKHGNYGLAYDELACINRKKKLNSSWNEAMQRAQTITESFLEALGKEPSYLHEFWNSRWKDSYEGFCNVRDELANLREIVFHGNSEKSREQELFRNILNKMLRSNAREWFTAWGELDLHRLSPNDALDSLQRCICTWVWDEVRIISGQRAHNGDHVSKGVLFNLIHSVTGRTEPDSSKFDKRRIEDIKNTRKYIHENGIEVFFYSDGGALYLRRSEEAQREYLKSLERTPRSSRQKSVLDEKPVRRGAVSLSLPKEPPRKREKPQKSRRRTRSSAISRNNEKKSNTPTRRSPRLAKPMKKAAQLKQ